MKTLKWGAWFPAAIISTLLFTTASAQTEWTRYEGNPVLRPSGCGSAWDCRNIDRLSVVFNGSSYLMWYRGTNPSGHGIGLATSPDGISWTRYEGNPVFAPGDCGTGWDCTTVDQVSVVFDGDLYRMWFRGFGLAGIGIGLATSPDGIDWTPYRGNPVYTTPSCGGGVGWDCSGIDKISVAHDGSNFHLFYRGSNPNGLPAGYGYAKSPDGIHWTRHDKPIMSPTGCPGPWDCGGFDQLAVIFEGDLFHMFYRSGPIDLMGYGYATSSDGISWNKYQGPVLAPPGCGTEWDCRTIDQVSVVFDGNSYRMWYRGGNNTGSGIGYATSPSPAVIEASPRCGYAPLEVGFSLQTSLPFSGVNWKFGDGSSSAGTNAVHSYSQAGSYRVSAAVDLADGGSLQVGGGGVRVFPTSPRAVFTPEEVQGRAPLEVRFQDHSAGEIGTRLWDFGDGSGSAEASPTHTYQEAGTYTVTLSVSGPCPADPRNTSVASGTVVVSGLPSVELVQRGTRCVTILVSNALPVQGGEVGIAYDPTKVTGLRVSPGPDFPFGGVLRSRLDDGSGCSSESAVTAGLFIGWINQVSDSQVTDPGQHEIIKICFEPAAGAEPGACSDLRFVECLGVPGAPVRNIVTGLDFQSHALFSSDGKVCLGPESPFRRGDSNEDGNFDISDSIMILGCLFLGTQCPRCPDSMDSNDDGKIDIADPISLLSWRFNGGTEPSPPFPSCGVDPQSDDLDPCDGFAACR